MAELLAERAQDAPLSVRELRSLHAYWRAANYLSVGQIYLFDNPLLREPLTLAHVKPRLLGHWGTTPGLNFIYAHLNRLIRARDLDVLYIAGPGHGGPALAANTYLEGTHGLRHEELRDPVSVSNDAAPLLDRPRDGGKGTRQQDEVGHPLGHLTAVTHGNPEASLFKGQHVIDAVAGHRNVAPAAGHRLDEIALLFRSDAPVHDRVVDDPVERRWTSREVGTADGRLCARGCRRPPRPPSR